MPDSVTPFSIRRLSSATDDELAGLCDVLIDCVHGGASVGFLEPLSPARALAFWRSVIDGVERGQRVLLVAEDAAGIVGTVQLALAQLENQPHRADLSKLLVHRRARRRGLGELLMRAAEDAARGCGRSLLVLDTATGDAERLYERLGWSRSGTVPGYALMHDGELCDTTFFYRRLDG